MADSPTNSLRIETGFNIQDNSDDGILIEPPTPMRERAQSSSQLQGLLPSLRVTSAIERRPQNSALSQGMSKARSESRKLLAHLLGELQRRSMPPPAMEAMDGRATRVEKGLGAVVRSLSGIAGTAGGGLSEGKGRRAAVSELSDDDSDDETSFHTDVTFDLMSKLKEVLVISIAQGWDIFYEESDESDVQNRRGSTDKPRRKRRRSSLVRTSRSRSRSSSPSRDAVVNAPELLSQCISILSSVILEDCRYQISSPKPSKPPNALQAVTLDVAQFLIFTHKHEPRVLSEIGFAVLPSFQTFPPSMHIKLLAFFEERVLGWALYSLSRAQGVNVLDSPAEVAFDDPQSSKPPMVSILVDEVGDDVSPQSDKWRRWTSLSATGTQSTTAPDQPIAVYYLSSLIPPLLATILEHVDLLAVDDTTSVRFHRFFRNLIRSKPDTYLDLLSVIAYHTPRARHASVGLLSSYWPKAVGHIVFSKQLPDITSPESRLLSQRRSSVSRNSPSAHGHPYAHQFIPWRFGPPLRPVLFDGLSPNTCRVCFLAIEGFGLLCPFCMCAVHFDCYDYPDGSFFTQYPMATDRDIQKVSVHRFCHVLPNTRDGSSSVVSKQQHIFRMVNIFSMSLCFICHQPLWGYVMQGLKCSSCRQFVHSSCLDTTSSSEIARCRSVVIDSTAVTIAYSALRHSFVEYYKDSILTEVDLPHRSHEELAVFYAILWCQLRLLDNGLALGSIVIVSDSTGDPEDEGVAEEFELHYLVELYESYLSLGRLPVSDTLADYLAENGLRLQDCSIYFDWNVLAFFASTIKIPCTSEEARRSSELLGVDQLEPHDDSGTESSQPYETMTLGYLRDQLGDTLNMFSDTGARHLLSHLHHLGLLHRMDGNLLLLDGPSPAKLQCCFPLPFGFDISVDVETLVATIEACLSDINLSVNEIGLLQLIRRFWPNGMLSDYTFRRLAKAALAWILSEDNNLAVILREYVAKGSSLPGVRGGESMPWPPQTQLRSSTSGAASNGGDYVATRRALLAGYVAPWLLALHDQDIVAYAALVYELLSEYAEEDATHHPYFVGEITEKEEEKRQNVITDKILRLIVKACQTSIVFTVFDDLFQRWLERAQILENYTQPIPSLPRLFSREGDGSQRHTIMIDARFSVGDLSALANANPLQAMMNIANSNQDGFRRAIRWLCLFASSGVDIPVQTFLHFGTLASKMRATLEDCSLLIEATLYSSWLRSVGRLDLQTMIGAMHAKLLSEILSKLQASENVSEIFIFIRRSLATCLLLYGCERKYLLKLQMIEEDEIENLPSRRKLEARASTMTDPIIIDTKLMNALGSYIEKRVIGLSCLVAKFLNAFVNQTSLVESYEVDNFILRNAATLCSCIWEFYGIQSPELSSIRPALLVRVLVVDAQPFQFLLVHHLDMKTGWEVRLDTVLRLFRIILDVINPAFVVEDRQWGPNVIDVFHHFFTSMWLDEQEEIRTAVDTWSQTLLPAHFEAIARCWNEALSKSPISERVKLVSFLSQLRSHFPAWRVLMWETIIEALLENDFMQKGDEDGPAAAHLSLYGLSSDEGQPTAQIDPELILLRVGLISLSLRMIADGISIDTFSLLRLKDQIARALGFQDVTLVPSSSGHTFHIRFGDTSGIPSWAFPSITDLMLVLDSAHPYDLAGSAMGGPYVDDDSPTTLLVGSAFVDLVLGLFTHTADLASLPPLTLKNLIKGLLIAIQKHDFDSRPLRHLQGDLRKAIRLNLFTLVIENSLSYDLRQLAFSATQAFIKRCPTMVGNFVFEAMLEVIKMMVTLDYEQKAEDLLVLQATVFLETILQMFSMSGIMAMLFKKRLEPNFFRVLRHVLDSSAKSTVLDGSKENLREILLRDTLSRVIDSDVESYQTAVENLQDYVEIVYHTAYNSDLMQCVGLSLTNIARKAADWAGEAFDASPTLLICCTLIHYNKSQSRELVLYLETLLRATLVRFRVTAACLTRLLQVTSSLYRRRDTQEQQPPINVFAVVLLEMLSDALSAKCRLPHSTLAAAVEIVMSNTGPLRLSSEKLAELAACGIYSLQMGCLPDSQPQDFAVSQAVARMVLQIAEQQPSVLFNLNKRPLNVRIWNLILLAALSLDRTGGATLLLDYFQSFTQAYHSSLILTQSAAAGYSGPEDVDISRAYISIKLWLLLSHKAARNDFDASGQENDRENFLSRMIWTELWPPFEATIEFLEGGGPSNSSLMLASASVADLFLFLHQSRSILTLEWPAQMSVLARLRAAGRAESKISRVLRSINEAPPDVAVDFFISQIATEIAAEERLLSETAKLQDLAKSGAEKGRRIVS